jgi:hypothetical protein
MVNEVEQSTPIANIPTGTIHFCGLQLMMLHARPTGHLPRLKNTSNTQIQNYTTPFTKAQY